MILKMEAWILQHSVTVSPSVVIAAILIIVSSMNPRSLQSSLMIGLTVEFRFPNVNWVKHEKTEATLHFRCHIIILVFVVDSPDGQDVVVNMGHERVGGNAAADLVEDASDRGGNASFT
ncbi:hypothetical protein SEVIR_6G089750v4 [Setaria viridis]